MNIKDVQLWIHHHYNGIKLVLLTLTLLMVGLVYWQMAEQRREDERIRAEQVAAQLAENEKNLHRAFKVLDDKANDINAKADKNTRLINQNIQLLVCLLAVHGESQFVTGEDEERCREAIDNAQPRIVTERESAPQSTQQPFEPEPSPTTSPADPPDEPEEPEDPGLTGVVERAVDDLLDLLP